MNELSILQHTVLALVLITALILDVLLNFAKEKNAVLEERVRTLNSHKALKTLLEKRSELRK